MKNFYIRKILNDEQIEHIRKLIENANAQNSWIDGLNSGGGEKRIKNNLELSDINISKVINDCIMNSLDSDIDFLNFTCPKSTNLNIVSKTTSGGYYNPHLDNWSNGDYSTTVFLNDPSDYDGGELCLYLGDDEEKKIKLDAGWGITYSTGIIHRVNKVISGTRYVSVFWTESLVKDSFIRFILGEISNAKKYVPQNPVHLSSCLSASKDPSFILDSLKTQILRRYAK